MNASVSRQWRKEPGARLQGSRPLDSLKLQAPGVVRLPSGGFRLFYTAVGPARPFPTCQGYILSAVSKDGLVFRKERGIRLAPQPALPHMSLRVLSPTVTRCDDGRWRMYFESRGPADRPRVICSAISSDMLDWKLEEGIRLQGSSSLLGPRYLALPGGGGRLHCIGSEEPEGAARRIPIVVSAITSDGLEFTFEPGHRLRATQEGYESAGITAADVLSPSRAGDPWTMFYSAWEDVPPGVVVPPHPSQDPNAEADGLSANFAAASIASDMAGFRSRIFVAHSTDGLTWNRSGCVIEGLGHSQDGLDAVHAEDMSVIEIGDGAHRMYYAACDAFGNWRIASAVSAVDEKGNHS